MRDVAAMDFDTMARDVVGVSHTQRDRLTLPLTNRTTWDPADLEARQALRAMGNPRPHAVYVTGGPSYRASAPRPSVGRSNDSDIGTYEQLLQLDENNVSRAAPASVRARHMRRVTPKNGKDMCLVCHEEYGVSREKRVVALPCGHEFHGDCINQWFDREKTCPVCRKELGQK